MLMHLRGRQTFLRSPAEPTGGASGTGDAGAGGTQSAGSGAGDANGGGNATGNGGPAGGAQGQQPAGDNAPAALQQRLDAAQAELDRLRDEKRQRELAELSEADRLKQEATDAKAEADRIKLENLRLRHAKDLPEEALEFVTATDEAGIKAQVDKLAAVYGKAGAQEGHGARTPARAGTQTQPQGAQQPTAQEQIAAAVKSGNEIAAIRLMRQQQFRDS